MQTVTKYVTVDGEEFDSENEARKHENFVDLVDYFSRFVYPNCSGHDIAEAMMDNFAELEFLIDQIRETEDEQGSD